MGSILFFVFLVFAAIFGAYLYFAYKSLSSLDEGRRSQEIEEKIATLAQHAWFFIQPILQAALVIAIAIYAFSFFNFDLNLIAEKLDWDFRALLAFVVVAAFAISAIGGSNGAHLLKDVALVVVGFYFGGLGLGG